jgi:hypothetical protein
VAVNTDEGVFLSWRLFLSDYPDIGFNVYRNGQKLNDAVLGPAYTDYLDDGASGGEYQVEVLSGGRPVALSEKVSPWAQDYKEITLAKPTDTYLANGTPYSGRYFAIDAAPVDLDGDGELDLLFFWQPENQQDSSRSGVTGNVLLDAYRQDGTKIWGPGKFIDLGPNIRGGNHDQVYSCADFDGDGTAEIAIKTAPLTVDAAGKVLGEKDGEGNITYYTKTAEGDIVDAQGDPVNIASLRYATSGWAMTGSEYLSLFSGATGKLLDTIDYPVSRAQTNPTGSASSNQSQRFVAGVAYLGGPGLSILMQRGYYSGNNTATTMSAVDWDGTKLKERWIFSTRAHPRGTNPSGWGTTYEGQGNHSMAIADVDGDGADEIVLGGLCIDHNGTPLWRTGLGHGDAMHLGDLDPARPGLELFVVHEDNPYGMSMHDAATGAIIWRQMGQADSGRGVTADIDPDYPGEEAWGNINSYMNGVTAANGTILSANVPTFPPGIYNNIIDWANQSGSYQAGPANFAIYWDGATDRELLDGGYQDLTGGGGDFDPYILKGKKDAPGVYVTELVKLFSGMRTNSGTKQVPTLQADIFGDWREEVVLRDPDSSVLRIYTTTIPTVHEGPGAVPENGIPTLQDNHQYWMNVLGQHAAYNQPPHASWFIGYHMDEIR